MDSLLFAVYTDPRDASATTEDLLSRGFPSGAITVITGVSIDFSAEEQEGSDFHREIMMRGLSFALVRMGVAEDAARLFDETVRAGGTLLAMLAEAGEEEEIREVMRERSEFEVTWVDVERARQQR